MPYYEKAFEHWLNWHGFSTVCVLKWFFKLHIAKCLWTFNIQWYVFSTMCVLKCFFKLLSTEKDFGHWLQGNNFHLRMFTNVFFKLLSTEKVFKHWLQGYDFSRVCVLKFLLGFNIDIQNFKNHCYNAEVYSNDTVAFILIATVQVSISPLFMCS